MLAGRTILVALAHPDDESLACGGTLAWAADAGARVVLLCASRGGLGSSSDPGLRSGDALAAERAREIGEAARVLGIEEVILLDHEDGYLRWNAPGLDADLVATLDRFDPDAVVTFDADGLYWHGDHIGMHERTTKAVAGRGADAPPLYYVTLPPGGMRGIVDAAARRGGERADRTYWGIDPDAFGTEAEAPTFTLDVRPWADRKLSAIRAHRTQIGARSPLAWVEVEDVALWLGREAFRRAPVPTRRPDVLERLGARSPRGMGR